jgi:HK97 gp10 family phage protein
MAKSPAYPAGTVLALVTWATAVFNSSQELVPVDTGELKESGHVVVTQTGKTVSAAVVYDSEHSVFLEYGTGIRGAASAGAGDGPYNPNWPGQPAQPYLRPAFDQHRDEAQSMTRETIAVALR